MQPGPFPKAASSLLQPAPSPSDTPPQLAKGMAFPDSKAAFYAVQDYALYHGKQVRVGSRGGKHRRMVCASKTHCPFFVQLYVHNSKTNRTWYVSSFNLTHGPQCTSTAKPTQRQIMAMGSFQQAIHNAPNGTAAQLLATVEGKANLRTIYRAKETMKRALMDTFSASYKKIPSLLTAFLQLNPGSFATFDVDELQENAFKRAFIACGVFTTTVSFNQQIYGLECVPCSNRDADYEGVQLFLLGKDGNLQTVVVAAAVCPSPTRENYLWFFRCVDQAGVTNLRYCPILSAIDTELLSVENELGLTFKYCTRYVIERELTQLGAFNPHHHTLVWGLQSAETEDEYNSRLEWIGTACGHGIETYLRQLAMERWVVAGNVGKTSLYGWRSRNFTESAEQDEQAASIINSLRNLLPFAFLEGVMVQFMKDAFTRSDLATKWMARGGDSTGSGRTSWKITSCAQELYDLQYKRVGEYKVTRASDTVAFVSKVNMMPPSQRRRVDLQANTCSCAFIDQFAIPCRHMIAVLLFCDQMETVTSRFAPGYLVENYAMAYRGKAVELPLDSHLSTSDACNRAISSHASGRRRSDNPGIVSVYTNKKTNNNKRPRSAMTRDEMGNNDPMTSTLQPQRLRLCKKCRNPGHNMRSCSYQSTSSL